ncbi:uncharacterized protein LOC129565890 isoform X1 [Sitodiplosis mosellana]|uniref:uncharacterized protein LOC129565890 isoform X1 n=1 Tax=Sitodiplosis mosellana TaxID=263140 RepID=UPI00244411E5|nr:uncharacterized protein LOC129565890 isoform X1 [Sitodiplosis mosellana]
MLSFVVLVMFAATVANAGFHKHRYFTTDMNGFHNFGRHYGFGQHGRFGPPPPVYGPPPPVYGPPPPFVPQFHQGNHPHHHGHHQHSPQCNHKPGDGFGTFPFTSNTMPSSTDTSMPIIPNMNNPFIHDSHFPFNPKNPFFANPNQNGGNIPPFFGQNNFGFVLSNLPLDPLPTSNSIFNTNTMSPLDANTALIDHRSTTTPSIIDANNGGNQPQNPYIPPNQTKGSPDATGSSTDANQNNGNNYNGTGAIATDNDFDSVDEPSAATTTTTPSPAQGKYNGLDYDIDVRFSDSKNDNRTNQKPLDTIKP